MNNSTSTNDQPDQDRAQNDSKKHQPKDGAQNGGKQNKCAREQDELYPYSMYPGIP